MIIGLLKPSKPKAVKARKVRPRVNTEACRKARFAADNAAQKLGADALAALDAPSR